MARYVREAQTISVPEATVDCTQVGERQVVNCGDGIDKVAEPGEWILRWEDPEPMKVEGDGMAAGEPVAIWIEDDRGSTIARSQATADDDGKFEASYQLTQGHVGDAYTMHARGVNSGTEFSDIFNMDETAADRVRIGRVEVLSNEAFEALELRGPIADPKPDTDDTPTDG